MLVSKPVSQDKVAGHESDPQVTKSTKSRMSTKPGMNCSLHPNSSAPFFLSTSRLARSHSIAPSPPRSAINNIHQLTAIFNSISTLQRRTSAALQAFIYFQRPAMPPAKASNKSDMMQPLTAEDLKAYHLNRNAQALQN
jgi:hypothetical protein